MAPAVREGQEWLCEGRIRISFGEPPFHVSYRPPRLSGHGGRGVLHVPRMAGVWGAGASMVAASGLLGPVALIPHLSLSASSFERSCRTPQLGVAFLLPPTRPFILVHFPIVLCRLTLKGSEVVSSSHSTS